MPMSSSDNDFTNSLCCSSSSSSSSSSRPSLIIMISRNSNTTTTTNNGRRDGGEVAHPPSSVPAVAAPTPAAVRHSQIARAIMTNCSSRKQQQMATAASLTAAASTAFSPLFIHRLLTPSSGTLLPLALLFCCCLGANLLPPGAHAAPSPAVIGTANGVRPSPAEATTETADVHVPIGAVFTLHMGTDRSATPSDGFPGWARLNDSAGQVYGIPQSNDVGVYTIPLHGKDVRIEVGNELKQWCEEEMKTIWLEIVDQQRIDELSMESQFNSVKSLVAKLGVRLADVRLFPFNYLDTYRTVTEIMQELEPYQQHHNHPEQQHKIVAEQIVYTVNISCGELNEQASEVINAAIENGLSFQVVQGILVNIHHRQPASSADSDATPVAPVTGGQQQQDNDQSGGGSSATGDAASSSPTSAVPLIILALILAVLILVGIFWTLIKRAKAGQEKQTADTNGKAHAGATHLPSPAGDSTTPMLGGHRGNAERTIADDGMASENGAPGRNNN